MNKILEQSLEGLMEMIYLPGLINIDWADLRAILEGKGKLCYLNCVEEKKDKGVEEIVKMLLQSPLNEYNIQGADKILYNIASDKDLKMEDVEQISSTIASFNPRAKIIFGISQHPKYKDKIKITLLATGCGEEEKKPTIKKSVNKKEVKPEVKEVKQEAVQEAVQPKEEKIVEKEQISEPKKEEESVKKEEPKKEEESVKKETPVKKMVLKRKRIKIRKSKPEIKEEDILVKEVIASPVLVSKEVVTKRRNAMDLRKDSQDIEREILEEENKWDTPAFLRNKKA